MNKTYPILVSLVFSLWLGVALGAHPPTPPATAQTPPNDLSTACFAEVKLGFWVDLLRGPSYALFGIKRTIPAEQELRVLAQDASGDWVQVYHPRTDTTGWMLVENLLRYGRCRDLPVLTDAADFEPEGPPPDAPFTTRPDFVAEAIFSEAERAFLLDDSAVYVLHQTDTVRAHVLLLDLNDARVHVTAALTGTAGRTMGLVSTLASDSGAFAAINADFWTSNRVPQNLMVVDGVLITAPTNRATFALTADKQAYIGPFTDDWTWDASVTAENGASIPLQLVNTGCEEAWLCLYTDIYPTLPLQTRYDGLRILLDPDYEVLSIAQNLPLDIPTGHFALRTAANSPAAQWLRNNVAVGDTLSISLPTDPDWQDFDVAIGGGPLLIRGGEFWQDCDQDLPADERICENFDLNFRLNQYGRALQARSAVGVTAANALVLVMVEGNGVYASQGITQRDLAELMLRMGVVDGMEFDGGRSSALWVDTNLVNGIDPTRTERNVTNALLVFLEDDTG